MLSSSDNSVQADCHEKVFIPKPKRFCIKRFSCRHVCHEKNIFKSPRQVQNEGQVQHEGSTGEPVADEMTMEPKINFRIQGKSRAEVEQDDEKSRKQHIARLV